MLKEGVRNLRTTLRTTFIRSTRQFVTTALTKPFLQPHTPKPEAPSLLRKFDKLHIDAPQQRTFASTPQKINLKAVTDEALPPGAIITSNAPRPGKFHVSINEVTLNEDTVPVVAKYVENPDFESMGFNRMTMTIGQLRSLIEKFSSNITAFSLRHSVIDLGSDPKEVWKTVSAIANNQQIYDLHIFNNTFIHQLPEKEIAPLWHFCAQLFSTNDNALRNVTVEGHALGDEGAKYAALAITLNGTWCNASLANSGIGAQGAALISDAVDGHPHLSRGRMIFKGNLAPLPHAPSKSFVTSSTADIVARMDSLFAPDTIADALMDSRPSNTLHFQAPRCALSSEKQSNSSGENAINPLDPDAKSHKLR